LENNVAGNCSNHKLNKAVNPFIQVPAV